MSDAVSELAERGVAAKVDRPKLAAIKGEAAQTPAEPEAPGPMVEHPSDLFETRLEYDHSSKVPLLVIAVWVCAFVGFALYLGTYLFPDLALWGKP